MLLLIDNFDSFTHNLVQAFQSLGAFVRVFRSNAISIEECLGMSPSRLVISPGPGSPKDSGISKDAIRVFSEKIPILGVCLGHQCIGELFGGRVLRASVPMHGKLSAVYHDGQGIYRKIPQGFQATRYHSLVLEKETIPDSLTITSWTQEGEIMGCRHKKLPIEGVQFHPESVLTEDGLLLLRNFLETEA